tara:strand:- start:3760 stop:5340 length:1581 start_codon:yes stop_codon:yes gene_type:complete
MAAITIEKNNDLVASETTGTIILTASKEFASFAVTTETTLTNFIDSITGADSFITNLPGEIKSVARLISSGARSFISKIGNTLADALIKNIQSGLLNVATRIFSAFPKFRIALAIIIRIQQALVGPSNILFNAVDCLTPKVTNALTGAVEDMLTQMVKNVLNTPACAIQQFIGAVTTKISSLVDSLIGPVSGGLGKVLGSLTNVRDVISGGLDLFDAVGDFFNCSDKPRPGIRSVNKYAIDATDQKDRSQEEQQNFIDRSISSATTRIENIKSGTKEKLTNFENTYGQWNIFGSKVSEAKDRGIGTDCDTGNNFKCGSPRVDIFGGDGTGGAGKVLLGKFVENFLEEDGVSELIGETQRTASILGVEITDPGEGYTQEPIAHFTDSCGQGFGAFGKVIIDRNVNSPTYGQITDIIILSEGENFPVDLPAEVGQVFIDKIIIENPGKGYENSSIDDKCMILKTIDGKITEVEITCQKPYTSIPEIIIKNPGIGAILRPVMSSKPRFIDQEVIQSVDCVGKFPESESN